ncbi:hypothetical protein DFH94DRAFT_674474 [Russula ochroleuca]|uniref:ubiquitinyl hydrolase 1 n=1 Tax=Russula ochroleuca TaxID=152965 RepID=A0A9P5JZW1_9AGAM|nr:hypothetical protein DFH94DRAFT_674474 [Russula ochroleuca]
MSLEAPSDDATPLYAHSRKLDDNENMYLASAVLQSLVYCPPFRELFRDLDHREGGETGGGVSPLVDATVRFLDEFAYKEKSLTHQATRGKVKEDEDVKNEGEGVHSFLSTDVYDALKQKRQFIIMRDDRQQDAAVFLGLYLEALDEELVTLQSSIGKHKPSSAPKVDELEEERDCTVRQLLYLCTEFGDADSPISRIFGGRSRLTVRALNQPDTVTVEDWGSLKLNIQHDSVHTIQDALAHVSLPQPVRVGNSGSGEANQQVLLEALPPVLILHLERFLYDAAADGKYKIRKPVQFAPELEIPHEIMVPISGKYLEPAHYKLCGTLYHHGESASGHYTVDVFHPNGDNGGSGAWLHIDEGAVSTVQHEDVFGGHNNEQVDDRCAYMLFYCRTAPART